MELGAGVEPFVERVEVYVLLGGDAVEAGGAVERD